MEFKFRISIYSHVDLRLPPYLVVLIFILTLANGVHDVKSINSLRNEELDNVDPSSKMRHNEADYIDVYYNTNEFMSYLDTKNGFKYNLTSSDSQILHVHFDSDLGEDFQRGKNETFASNTSERQWSTNPRTTKVDEWALNATKTSRSGDAISCGEANPNGKSTSERLDRIIGGSKTEPGEFPFQVRLNIRSRRGSGICGGVLIDNQHLLTAAHCVTTCLNTRTTITLEKSSVNVTLGDHSIKSNDGEVEVDIDYIRAHERYDACNFIHNNEDIAIIKLTEPIDYRFTIDGYGSINRPCMPKSSLVAYKEGERVIVSGWGVISENQRQLSNILRFVQVEVVNTKSCQRVYRGRVTETGHVCAGMQFGGKDSCQGDSGGPLVRVVENNRYELVGIVSFGYGCAQAGSPGVYTRVANYLDWIKANKS